MRFLIDTDVLSEPLKPEPDAKITEQLQALGADFATSAMNLHELLFGARRLPRGRRRGTLEGYVLNVVARTLPVLPYDDAAAAWHADERARLERAGRTLPFADGQIAAIAAVNELFSSRGTSRASRRSAASRSRTGAAETGQKPSEIVRAALRVH